MAGFTRETEVVQAAMDRGCPVSEVWEGMARMAHARRLAGVELTGLDQVAMRKHPEFKPVRYDGPVLGRAT